MDTIAEVLNIDTVALQAGSVLLISQLLLTLLFRFVLPAGPWRDEPGFTAHQVVCLPYLLFCCCIGGHAWFFDESPRSAEARVLGNHAVGTTLTQVMLGAMLLWDTPTGFIVASLRDPVMLGHHILMFFTAVCGKRAWRYYGCCFFGAVEFSGIPLVIVDLFHPKHPGWSEFGAASPLKAINDLSRLAFAAAFMVVRAFYFPYVVATQVLPDAFAVFTSGRAHTYGVSNFELLFVPISGVVFSFLQLYWAMLIVKQAMKQLRGPAGKKEE
mmetsp:Transcript_14890/g.32295  ORF Transcript_14890/g.32295 Transcript_14890/m.32295 type:complete len:270 (-) Transcript_14890:243-1052(-)